MSSNILSMFFGKNVEQITYDYICSIGINEDLEAVKQNGKALQFVKNQTLEICLEAVKQNGESLEYVKNKTYEMF